MSSRDTTPEVSPIRSALRCRDSDEDDVEMAEVKEDELEDGEISDETGQDNLSTISDDDLNSSGNMLTASTSVNHEMYEDLNNVSSPIFNQENFQAESVSNNSNSQSNFGNPGDNFESPESPDMDTVTGSPVKLIPVSENIDSPLGSYQDSSCPSPASDKESSSNENENQDSESEGVESEEDDDDIDEDILYLRLIALRSLAADAEAEEKKNKENQLELEMQQLLQEAQDAAEEAGTGQPTTEEAVNVRSTAASEETIPDNTNIADESSKNEKSQILDASNKTGVKELAENRNLEDNKQNSGKKATRIEEGKDDITLIKVLVKKERKINLTVIDLVSPPLSPKQNNEEEKTSVPEDIPLPSLPPLPDQNAAAPPPPPPPRTPPPLPPPTPSSTQSMIPPPPGEGADNFLINQPYPPSSNQNWNSILHPPVCTSGTFFNAQPQDVMFGQPIQGVGNQHQGPTPWQMAGQYPVPYSYGEGLNAGQMHSHLERPEYSDVAHFLSVVNNYTYQDWNQPEVLPPPPPSTVDKSKKLDTQESYDDFAPTVIYSNNKTLTSVKRTRTRKKSKGPKRRKLSSNSFTEDDEESLRALLLNQIIDKVQKKDQTPIDKPMEKESAATVDDQVQKKIVKDVESVKVKNQLEKPKAMYKEIPVKLKKTTKPILHTDRKPSNANVKKLSNTVMLKHFPNMSKKMIIPLNEPDSDEDDIMDTNETEKPAEISFQSNLDQFLKGIRSNKTTSTKLNSSNPEKRKRLSLQLKAMYNKKDSAKSDISNLPLSKQIEYLHLKQLIAKKEGKLKNKADSVAPTSNGITNKVKAITSSGAKPTAVKQTSVMSVTKKAVVKVTPITKKASIDNSASTKKYDTTVAPLPNSALTKKAAVKVTPNTNAMKAEVKVSKDSNTTKKSTVEIPVADTSGNKTRISPEVTIVGIRAGDSVNQAADNKVTNKTEEDDEDILREMLLKEMQDKAKITINLDGDQRKVRVKKYNLTPNFQKNTEADVTEQNVSRLSRIDQNIAKSKKSQDSKITSKEESMSKVSGPITDQVKPTNSSINSKTSSFNLTFQSRSVPNSPGKPRSPDARVPPRPKSGSPLSRSMPSSPTNMLRSNSPSQVKDDIIKTTISSAESKTEGLVELEKSVSSLSVGKATVLTNAISKPISSKDKLETVKEKVNDTKAARPQKLTNQSIITRAAKKGEPVKGEVKSITLKKNNAKIPDPRVKRLKQPIKPVSNVRKVAAQSTKLQVMQVKPVPSKGAKKIDSEKEKELKPLASASKEMIKELQKEENIVIEKRGGLTTVLYRMSAQISQLEKWGGDLESAKTLKEKLVKELNQVAKIITQREAGIDKTKTEIRDSHIKVNQLRDEMESSEVRCEALGGQVYGPSTYTLTDKGAAEYRKKLDQIKNSAHKFTSMATASSGSGQPVSVKEGQQKSGSNIASNISGNIRSSDQPAEAAQSSVAPPGQGVKLPALPAGSIHNKDNSMGNKTSSPDDYVSPLNHVRSSTNPGIVFDPDKMLCRFELGGKCLDTSCPFQHVSSGR